MDLYQLYGLCIASELPLPGYPTGQGAVDATVRLRALDDEDLERQESWGGRVWGHINNRVQFLVDGGRRIVLDVRAPVDETRLQGYVTGVLMAALLRQRGLLVLHACCMAKEEGAIGFLGESGWGKSTLAEFFCQNDYDLITDDLLAIKAGESSRPVVLPGSPLIKLRPESGGFLRDDYELLPRMAIRGGRRISSPDALRQSDTPLRKLYVLEPTYSEHFSIEPMSAREGTLALMRHTRVKNLIKDPQYSAQHLQQCSMVSQQIPIALCRRRRSISELGRLVEMVEADLELSCGADTA